jgi:hypothetical protein
LLSCIREENDDLMIEKKDRNNVQNWIHFYHQSVSIYRETCSNWLREANYSALINETIYINNVQIKSKVVQWFSGVPVLS